jgi:hypothetical protein
MASNQGSRGIEASSIIARNGRNCGRCVIRSKKREKEKEVRHPPNSIEKSDTHQIRSGNQTPTKFDRRSQTPTKFDREVRHPPNSIGKSDTHQIRSKFDRREVRGSQTPTKFDRNSIGEVRHPPNSIEIRSGKSDTHQIRSGKSGKSDTHQIRSGKSGFRRVAQGGEEGSQTRTKFGEVRHPSNYRSGIRTPIKSWKSDTHQERGHP